MAEKRTLKRMREQRFLDHIYEGYHAGQRYCFVLGAGASRASGIRTGEEMMREWRNELKQRGTAYIGDCAQELGLDPKDYAFLFSEDHVLKNEDYFTLFDLRFAGKPNVAYAYLEREMEEKYPSYGYYPLAMLLSNTQNRLIITTNFDTLIEDALYTYTFRHPLVVGHESLASYIANDARHPVIAKIHRDLLFQPLNRKQDMDQLKNEWKAPLRSALSRYIPIVIGYAGGDRTLMTLLEEMELNGIYWCHLGEPSDKIKEIVEKQNGYLVKILGFDEVMFQIGDRFSKEAGFTDPCQYMMEQAEKRCGLYQKSFDEIKKKYEIQKRSEDEQPLSRDMQDDVFRLTDAMDRYDGQRSAPAGEKPDAAKLVSKALRELLSGNLEKAVELYTEAIALAPGNADYYNRRSVVLYKMRRYEDTLRDDTKAIELDPSNPDYYYSRGLTFHEMKHYKEAFRDKSKAIEMDPSKPEYYYSRNITRYEMKEYDGALQDVNKAIEMDPSKPDYYYSRGITFHVMKRYEDALRDKSKAIELDPSKPDYYSSRSNTLHSMGRYEEALQDDTKSIELDPSKPKYYYSRSITLHAIKRYEDALKDKSRAIELDPSNADYYYSRGLTLHAMKRYEEALQDTTKAIELDPSKSDYYYSRGITFHEMKHYEEALRDKSKAIELDPSKPDYHSSLSVTLHEMGQYEEAIQADTKSIELNPGNPAYYRSRAVTLRKVGRTAEARRDEQKAAELEQQQKGKS